MADIRIVIISTVAQKQLRKVPKHVGDKLLAWVLAVETKGIREVKKIPGFHDVPLQGQRQGQRSIRLNRSYRAIYAEIEQKTVEFISIEEVHKHEY